jgi:hypothetical protein
MQITLKGVQGNGRVYIDIMKIICNVLYGQSMIDLGCHRAPYTPMLGFTDKTYVDIQDRPLDFEDEQKWFVQSDVIEYMQKVNRRFDVSIASDLIEHLTEDDGRKLLQLMEFKSDKQIIFTPLGPWMLTKDDNPDSHRSAWMPDMLPEYLSIVLPDFHGELKIGAFFAIRGNVEEMQRIADEIKLKYDQN